MTSSPDLGTLQNVRIQDPTQLQDALAQVDRSRSYQTYSTITVDRYPDAATGGDVEVMLGPREIAENDIPNASFVNTALNYTHGYGVTAVSVNAVGGEGKPEVLVGQQPMAQVTAGSPPDLSFDNSTTADPSIYCGLDTTQNVVSGTTQAEFSYPFGIGGQDRPRQRQRGRHPDYQPDRQARHLAAGLRRFQPLPQQLTHREQPRAREP